MHKTEIKMRVGYRLDPLVKGKVRLIYKASEFSISDYDYYDSQEQYLVYVSDRKEPLEFTLVTIQGFINELRRKDNLLIPKFSEDATPLPSQQKKRELREEAPAQPVRQVEEEVKLSPATSGKFVHIKSTVDIFVTRDYGRFGVLQGNRSLNKTKIKRIKDEIAKGKNWLQYCPIMVVEKDGKLKVVDGQHRLDVAKQTGSYIYYVICDELSLYDIATMNSNTEKWSGKDFVNCYATTGNEHYVTLREFLNTYGYPLGVCLQLLTKGMELTDGSHDDIIKSFQTGAFKVRTEEIALHVAKHVDKFAAFPGYKSRGFIMAI